MFFFAYSSHCLLQSILRSASAIQSSLPWYGLLQLLWITKWSYRERQPNLLAFVLMVSEIPFILTLVVMCFGHVLEKPPFFATVSSWKFHLQSWVLKCPSLLNLFPQLLPTVFICLFPGRTSTSCICRCSSSPTATWPAASRWAPCRRPSTPSQSSTGARSDTRGSSSTTSKGQFNRSLERKGWQLWLLRQGGLCAGGPVRHPQH